LTSALAGGEWSDSRPCRFTPGEGWVDPRAGLDDMEKWKFLPHRDSNSDSLVVQSVVSRYTDYAIPALDINLLQLKTNYLKKKKDMTLQSL
jgi:hypothetical protein